MRDASRAVAILAPLVLLIGTAAFIYYRASGATQAGPRRADDAAVAVETAPVLTGTIREVQTFASSLTPRSQFIIAPKVAGRLERLAVDIGDPVERGQIVAWLDDDEFAQQVLQASAEVEVARAGVEEARSSLAIAQRDFDRVQSLREQGVASVSEFDAVASQLQVQQARLRLAEAQVSHREAALRAAEIRLSYTQVQATWPEETPGGNRVVGERFVDEGATLSANTPLMSIVDLDVLRAVFHVTERDYVRIAAGQDADVVIDALPDRTFPGVVSRLSPVFRQTSRQAEVLLEVPNPDRLLKPGMFARVRLELGRADDATIVPTSALVRRQGQRGVFLARDGSVASFVPISTGIETDNRVQVIEPPGLAGDVVTLGHHLLEDGATILVVGADDATIDAGAPEEPVRPG